MEAPADIPPIIRENPRPVSGPVAFLGLVALALAIALATGFFQIALPQCTFKTLTGLPCAFCGSTRALRALGHFHFVDAFWFNPLATLGVFGAFACAALATLTPQRFSRIAFRVKRWPLLPLGIALVILNWLFVLKFLPR
jgi:hypothetical protein